MIFQSLKIIKIYLLAATLIAILLLLLVACTPPDDIAGNLETAPPTATGAPSSVSIATNTSEIVPQPSTAPSATKTPAPSSGASGPDNLPIVLPPGFEISIFAENVPNARSMALGAEGTIFVGTRSAGNLYALVDLDADFRADQQFILGTGMAAPNGVAFRDGSLYVAEVNRILRYDDIEANLATPPDPVVVNDSFPTDGHHGWKFIRFGPDGRLYVPVGAPCNICEPPGPMYSTIMRMNSDGTGLEKYAEGVRNSVGFDFHPDTGELWFTDNGADGLGDDEPPDELNYAPDQGLHFGFPYCHGGYLEDIAFGTQNACDQYTPPAIQLGPHVASLGMRFYTGDMFPEEYRGQIFIAEHGSWNRKDPIGYRITLVRLDSNQAISYEVFAEGWLQGSTAWGRPVDLLHLPDGSLLVSDDARGTIYRISYTG